MSYCLNCENKLKFKDNNIFIKRCPECGWFTRIKFSGIDGKNTDSEIAPYSERDALVSNSKRRDLKIKRIEDRIIYCYGFKFESLEVFKQTSKKTGEALEKFLQYDKMGLSSVEKNILYKLKSASYKEIYKKIRYLEAKLECIELLNLLNF